MRVNCVKMGQNGSKWVKNKTKERKKKTMEGRKRARFNEDEDEDEENEGVRKFLCKCSPDCFKFRTKRTINLHKKTG